MVSCRPCFPSYGPLRNFCSSLLLTIAAVGTIVAFDTFEVSEDFTPSPYSDVTTLTADVILYLTLALSGVAAVLNLVLIILGCCFNSHFRSNAVQKYFKSLSHKDRIYGFGLLGPSLGLTLVLLVRLFLGAPVFLGDPAALDFGWKYGIDSDAEAIKNEISAPEAEKNISFDPGSAYGHLLQGFFASVLVTPVVMRWLMKITCHKCNWLWKLAPFPCTAYPSYNLVKRFLYAYGEAFAGTSFANNNMEWSCGFVLGLALGQFITAVVAFVIVICFRNKAEGVTKDADAKKENEDPLSETACLVTVIQFIFVVALVGTLYIAGIFYGLTWHQCLDGTTCVNADSAPDEETLISVTVLSINVVVPTVLLFIGFFVWGGDEEKEESTLEKVEGDEGKGGVSEELSC